MYYSDGRAEFFLAGIIQVLICWFSAQEMFLLIINVEKSCAA